LSSLDQKKGEENHPSIMTFVILLIFILMEIAFKRTNIFYII